MAEVADLVAKRYKKLAEQFVKLYVEEGEEAAAKWLMGELREHHYDDFRPYVWAEFKDQGYEVIPYEELD